MPETVTTERMATGGEAVARLADGCVVFVRGALADERVEVEVTERKKRFARARLLDVIDASPDRTPLACDHAADACGGCDWLSMAPQAQRRWKVALVTDQLQRLGRIEDPVVGHRSDPPGARTTVRCVVTEGRAGFRARRGHQGFVADSCQASHPLVEQVITTARFPRIDEVTIRAAPSTGQRLVLLHGDVPSNHLRDIEVPDDVVITTDPDGAVLLHEVAGHRFQVSAGAFFQTSDLGAESLVAAVADALAGSDGPVADLYGGVGLLGIAAAQERLRVIVESNALACRDARTNLARLPNHARASVVEARVEQWEPSEAFPSVIADPARAGLGPGGVATISACNANHVVLVSCDPASLGRDAGLLNNAGWRLVGSEVVDMFPDTSRIEVVSAVRALAENPSSSRRFSGERRRSRRDLPCQQRSPGGLNWG